MAPRGPYKRRASKTPTRREARDVPLSAPVPSYARALNHDLIFRPKREPRTSWWLHQPPEGFTQLARQACRPVVQGLNNWERHDA